MEVVQSFLNVNSLDYSTKRGNVMNDPSKAIGRILELYYYAQRSCSASTITSYTT
jgi:hypothetical protein